MNYRLSAKGRKAIEEKKDGHAGAVLKTIAKLEDSGVPADRATIVKRAHIKTESENPGSIISFHLSRLKAAGFLVTGGRVVTKRAKPAKRAARKPAARKRAPRKPAAPADAPTSS